MTGKPDPIREEDLLAYVDGELSEARRLEVEAHLAEHEGDRDLVAEWQAQNETLKALFPKGEDDIPLDLDPREIDRKSIANDSAGWTGLRAMATSLILLVAGAAGGWFGHQNFGSDQVTPEAVAQLAINAHNVYSIDKRHPVEVTADQSDHLVKWLSKRLGTQLVAPDLSAQDYHLVGGRLLAATEGAAAQFMYEDSKGGRVTLFVTPNSTEQLAGFEFASQGLTRAFYWLDSSLNYTLVGEVDRDQLLGLATRLYAQWTEEQA